MVPSRDGYNMDDERSIVEYLAEHERYRCIYCGQSDTNYSHEMLTHAVTAQDLQDLLDRGWRRIGKYTCKPTMNMTCCPPYAMRCEALNFKIRKSQKRAIRKVNRYLIYGIKKVGTKDEEEGDESKSKKQSSAVVNQYSDASNNNQSGTDTTTSEVTMENADPFGKQSPKTERSTLKPGACPEFPCKKSNERKKETKLKSEPSIPVDSNLGRKKSCQTEDKILEELLTEPDTSEKCVHKLEIRLVRSFPKSEEFKDSLLESHSVYQRYQMAVHKDPPNIPNMKQFTQLMVDSSLQPKTTDGGLPMGYGSFHQQYILDGKIVCVNDIDILPASVYAKYIYYDPAYRFLSLGTYSHLRLITFVRDLNRYSANMMYYYMGFYVHSCPKITYKSEYCPSFLLCPETYTWHPVEKCLPILGVKKYSRFADKGVEDKNRNIELDKVFILHRGSATPYTVYKSLNENAVDEEKVREYAGFAGKTCAERMLLFRK